MKDKIFVYKSMFGRLYSLISSPDKTWQQIDEEDSQGKLFSTFFVPLLLLAAALLFIGKIIGIQHINIITAALQTGCMIAAFWAAFVICKEICKYATNNIFQAEVSDIQLDKIINYVLSIILTVKVVAEFLDFQFFKIFWLYSVFMFWKVGEAILKQDDDKKRTVFLLANTLSVICIPLIIEHILKLFVK